MTISIKRPNIFVTFNEIIICTNYSGSYYRVTLICPVYLVFRWQSRKNRGNLGKEKMDTFLKFGQIWDLIRTKLRRISEKEAKIRRWMWKEHVFKMRHDSDCIDVESWRAMESGTSKNYVEKDFWEGKERVGMEILEWSLTSWVTRNTGSWKESTATLYADICFV